MEKFRQGLGTLWSRMRTIRASLHALWKTQEFAWQTCWQVSSFTLVITCLLVAIGAMMPFFQIGIIAPMWVDSCLLAYKTGNAQVFVLPALLQTVYVGLDAGIMALETFERNRMYERVALHMEYALMGHAAGLDLAFFEDAEGQNLLEAAQKGVYASAISVVACLMLVDHLISFVSMVSLVGWLTPVMLIMPGIAMYFQLRFSAADYRRQMDEISEKRRIKYLSSQLMQGSAYQETRLLHLDRLFVPMAHDLGGALFSTVEALLKKRTVPALWVALGKGVVALLISIYFGWEVAAHLTNLSGFTRLTGAFSTGSRNFEGFLGDIVAMYQEHLDLQKFRELLEREPHITSPTQPLPVPDAPFAIEFRKVTFAYPGKAPVLRELSFRIEAGQSIALVGRNGVGKTTITKLLARFYDPDAGEILVGGINVKELDLYEWRSKIAMIFQEVIQFECSVEQNIGYGDLARLDNLDKIIEAARRGKADEMICSLPEGYKTLLGPGSKKGAMNLSGGQRQSLGTARFLMRADAYIQVADEPNASLDAKAEALQREIILGQSTGKTLILITHRLSTVRRAQRILFLEEGRIVEDGSHDALMRLNGRYAEMFTLQAQEYL